MAAMISKDLSLNVAILTLEIEQRLAQLRLVADEPVEIQYAGDVSLVVVPGEELVRVSCKESGITEIDYSADGLVVQVFAENRGDPLRFIDISSGKLAGPALKESMQQAAVAPQVRYALAVGMTRNGKTLEEIGVALNVKLAHAKLLIKRGLYLERSDSSEDPMDRFPRHLSYKVDQAIDGGRYQGFEHISEQLESGQVQKSQHIGVTAIAELQFWLNDERARLAQKNEPTAPGPSC
jgi:hypothetical protein